MSSNQTTRSSHFFDLTPRLQHGIAHTLGWSSLRPVQELTIEAVQRGDNCVVLAPTAGGKTEAAFFPILDEVARSKLAPVTALYISPIRALLNNQEPRLEKLGRLVGASIFKWHGDVPTATRRRFLADLAHILMTTPESLEVMLISPRVDKERIFAGLRFVVIDEVHNFAAGDRGAHLMAVIERLARYTPFDLQRIGLSATVGNPETISGWMQGSSKRASCVIEPPKQPTPRLIRIDIYKDEDELAARVAPLARGRKSLFFVEGRRLAEGVKQAISKVTAMSYVHHSSVGRDLREEAEAAFTYGADSQCIVCTSTMELGIDIGDLDAVLQIDAPATVSSFLQRLGRTGRRPGTQAEMNFFCNDDVALMRSVALVNLAMRGWIESVIPDEWAVHVLIHQALAQALQFAGVRRNTVWDMARQARPFSQVTPAEYRRLVDHLVARDILIDIEGLLAFGKAGEKRFGRRNFLDLYSVFETPEEVHIFSIDRREIGTLQTWFVQQRGSEGFIFVLAGRAWQVVELDLERGEMIVKPAPRGSVPQWDSSGPLLGRTIAEEIRSVLLAHDTYGFLTKRAQARLDTLRIQWQEVLRGSPVALQQKGLEWLIHTFAGDRINLLLARVLEVCFGYRTAGDSFSVSVKSHEIMKLSQNALLNDLGQMQRPDFFAPERIAQLVSGLQRGRLSKFQPLLPPDYEARFLASQLFDVEGLQETLKFFQRLVNSDAPLAKM